MCLKYGQSQPKCAYKARAYKARAYKKKECTLNDVNLHYFCCFSL